MRLRVEGSYSSYPQVMASLHPKQTQGSVEVHLNRVEKIIFPHHEPTWLFPLFPRIKGMKNFFNVIFSKMKVASGKAAYQKYFLLDDLHYVRGCFTVCLRVSTRDSFIQTFLKSKHGWVQKLKQKLLCSVRGVWWPHYSLLKLAKEYYKEIAMNAPKISINSTSILNFKTGTVRQVMLLTKFTSKRQNSSTVSILN